jgi:type II secretory pathway pseudopilin PulG
MSSREKKLLILFVLAGLVIVNVLLFSFYNQKKVQLDGQLAAAEAQLMQARLMEKSATDFAEEIEWLAENEPEPSAYQTVQTELQQFITTQANNFGLEIKDEDFLAIDTSGQYFHRAQIVLKLTGKEAALYRWLHAINDPTAFRAAFEIQLKPNSDDTLIDCTATVVQWFPPLKNES